MGGCVGQWYIWAGQGPFTCLKSVFQKRKDMDGGDNQASHTFVSNWFPTSVRSVLRHPMPCATQLAAC